MLSLALIFCPRLRLCGSVPAAVYHCQDIDAKEGEGEELMHGGEAEGLYNYLSKSQIPKDKIQIKHIVTKGHIEFT